MRPLITCVSAEYLPADKRHFPHEPHDEDENAPRKQKEWNVPVPGRMRSEKNTAEVEQIIEKIVIGHSDQSRQQTDEHADEIQPGIHQLQLPDVPMRTVFQFLTLVQRRSALSHSSITKQLPLTCALQQQATGVVLYRNIIYQNLFFAGLYSNPTSFNFRTMSSFSTFISSQSASSEG